MAVRPYKQGDEQQILSLFEKVFQSKMELNVWKWKYLYRINNIAPLILVFEEDGHILGHTAIWIHEAIIDGKDAKIGLRVDTMVDPDARGKGIYKQLSEQLIQEAKKENVSLLYGFPAAKAKELQIKYIQAHHLANINRWVYMNKPATLLSASRNWLKPIRFLDQVYGFFKRIFVRRKKVPYTPIQKADSFDELARLIPIEEKISLKRNLDYLGWRYADHPEHTYEILKWLEGSNLKGYIVYRMYLNEQNIKVGLILDLVAEGEHRSLIEQALLEKAIERMNDAAFVQAWTIPDQDITISYKKAGFFLKDEPMPLVIRKIDDIELDITNPENWFVSMGDVDSF